MSDSLLTLAERERTQLRAALAAVEDQVLKLPAARTPETYSDSAGALTGTWRKLVTLLAVEPEPERRACPFCKGPIMQQATRCVHCWKKSAADA